MAFHARGFCNKTHYEYRIPFKKVRHLHSRGALNNAGRLRNGTNIRRLQWVLLVVEWKFYYGNWE